MNNLKKKKSSQNFISNIYRSFRTKSCDIYCLTAYQIPLKTCSSGRLLPFKEETPETMKEVDEEMNNISDERFPEENSHRP